MNAQTLLSLDDLIRRFLEAGSRYPDVRSVLMHGLKQISATQLLRAYGERFHVATFRSLLQDDHISQLFCFRENMRRDSSNPHCGENRPRHGDSFVNAVNALRESCGPICERLQSLGSEAIQISRHFEVSNIPGADGINIAMLGLTDVTWYWLLHRIAWESPDGITLRASKFYPAGMMADAEHNAEILAVIQDDIDAGKYDAKRRAAVQSGYLECYDRHCAIKNERIAAGEFMSILPVDPFTASATLLRILREVAGTDGKPSKQQADVRDRFEFNESASRVSFDDNWEDVQPEGLRMLKLLAEANGKPVPMSKHGFTKASEVKNSLPKRFLERIMTVPGAGYLFNSD